ncbi:MAG TPA: hypothetical protein VH023_07315 [Rhodopila sp.]|nr:hypothetical protein [Rhodopila sp.]
MTVRQARGDHRQQIAPVDGDVGRPVELLAQRVERRLLQGAPVLPAALMRAQRAHAVAVEPGAEAQAAQDANRIRTHVDAAADLGQFRGLLEDLHRETGLAQRHGGAEAADPGADDTDSYHYYTGPIWCGSFGRRPRRQAATGACGGIGILPRGGSRGCAFGIGRYGRPAPAERKGRGG